MRHKQYSVERFELKIRISVTTITDENGLISREENYRFWHHEKLPEVSRRLVDNPHRCDKVTCVISALWCERWLISVLMWTWHELISVTRWSDDERCPVLSEMSVDEVALVAMGDEERARVCVCVCVLCMCSVTAVDIYETEACTWPSWSHDSTHTESMFLPFLYLRSSLCEGPQLQQGVFRSDTV